MLEWIAQDAHRFTCDLADEVVLVVPIRGGTPLPLVAIARGGAAQVGLDPAQAFRIALAMGADSLVLAHNHPGGAVPSIDDTAMTRRLVAIGAVLGLPVRAHLILTSYGWFDCVTSDPRVVPWVAAA